MDEATKPEERVDPVGGREMAVDTRSNGINVKGGHRDKRNQ